VTSIIGGDIESLEKVRSITEAWIGGYNEARPHDGMGA
jgi:hypothetical protein